MVESITISWQRVDTIDIAIVPGGKSEVGQSVIAAILSYVGKKIPVWREGRLTRIYGWSESHVISVHCLGKKRVAAVETVDAELLGQAHSVTSRVSFSAGLESLVEQLGLEGLGGLRRINLLPPLKYIIPVLLMIRKITRMSMSDRGGMIVDVKGLDADGKLRRVLWSLLAIQDDGPFVPVMPAAAAIRLLLQGQYEPGAYIGSQYLTLEAIKSEMVTHSITTRSETVFLDQGVFERALGQDRFDRLPPTLKAFHAFNGYPVWRGLADIDTGRGPISSLIAFFFRFPKTGRDVPVCVSVERVLFLQDEGGPTEVWMRNFSGQCFSSKLEGQADGCLTERFGPFTFEIALTADDRGIAMPVRAWQFFGIALPKFLAPRSEASEFEDEEGRFRFDVKLSLPLIGAIAHYRGWLKPNTGSN